MLFLSACTTNSYDLLNFADAANTISYGSPNSSTTLDDIVTDIQSEGSVGAMAYSEEKTPSAIPVPLKRPPQITTSGASVVVPLKTAPIFGDRKPHQWMTITPWHYKIHGTDISKYQGVIDWQRLKASGISFVFIKATEGGDHLDSNFAVNWYQAKSANLPRGAYHFYYFCRPARDQARWFIRNVPKDRSALPPVLDIEWNHTSPTCRIKPEPRVVRREIGVFLSMLQAYYGKKPIIYTTVDFFDQNDLRLLKNYRFWLRSVAGHPSEKYGSHPWAFWQYTGTGQIPGITGDADINVFHGSDVEWLSFINHQ